MINDFSRNQKYEYVIIYISFEINHCLVFESHQRQYQSIDVSSVLKSLLVRAHVHNLFFEKKKKILPICLRKNLLVEYKSFRI